MKTKENVQRNDLTFHRFIQEMIDDNNLYINRYSIFSKEPQKLQEVLKNCGVINWKQMFQIEGNKSEIMGNGSGSQSGSTTNSITWQLVRKVNSQVY